MQEEHVFDSTLETIWKFLRSDMKPQDFANWVYAQDDLETRLGETLYYDTIATNYSQPKEVSTIQYKLSQYAKPATDSGCRCIRLRDYDCISIVFESDDIFRFFDLIKQHDEPYTWLSVYRCRECRQWWFVVKEERVLGSYCLQRIDEEEAQRILNKKAWPEDFKKLEYILHSVQNILLCGVMAFPEDPNLVQVVVDLAKDRPGIKVSELAKLLGLDRREMKPIARKAINQENGTLDIQGMKL